MTDSKLQDIYIKVFGYDRKNQAGLFIPRNAPALVDFGRRVNTNAYLMRRNPLALIWFVGGEGPANRSNDVINHVDFIQRTAGPLGSIAILGGSAGGKNALEIAGKLTNRNMTIRYVGIADGAFQRNDISVEKPLTFKAPKIMCLQKENWYQSWGHTLDPRQELHGRIESFANIDLTDYSVVKQVKKHYDHNLISAQDALEEAHTNAYLEAFKQAETKIVWILGQNAQ